VDALYAALRGTPSVDGVSSKGSMSSNDIVANRDAAVLRGVEAVLEAHIPTTQVEVIDPRRLAFVRRCRWALLPYVSPDARSRCLELFLVRYLQTAQSCMYDVLDDAEDTSRLAQPDAASRSPLEEGAKIAIIEATEAFTEAAVTKTVLDERHYRPFLSFAGMIQLDPDIIENLLCEYEERHRHATSSHVSASGYATAADGVSLRCVAASSYAAAGFARRAVSIAKPEHLPTVVENTAKGRRSGWLSAMKLASCIEASLSPLTTPITWSSRDGRRGGSMAPLIAVCAALDYANRAQASRTYFDMMMPSIASTVLSWASAQRHHDPTSTDQADVETLIAKLARVAHPSSHWQEVLLVYNEYVKGAGAAMGKGAGDDPPSLVDQSGTSTPTGRVMHVLLMANRWQEALQVYAQTPHRMRDAHVSTRNYFLTAIAKKFAAGADTIAPPSIPPSNLPEAALVDVADADYNALRDAYVTQQTKNHFTHVTFVRALTECTHLVGAGSTDVINAMKALQYSPRARRLVEDASLHAAFGGTWETAVSLFTSHEGVQQSRYLGPIAVAACAQQHNEQACVEVLKRICTQSSQQLSRKQLTLCCAVMVACGASGLSSQPIEQGADVLVLVKEAFRRHQLIGSQEEYDAFAAQFLEFLSSAVLHRSRAAELSHETCAPSVRPPASENDDARQRRIAAEKHRTWRAMCIAATRRRRTADDITNPEKLMANLIALLEVPPKLTQAVATAELRTTYRDKVDYYSGSMRVGWVAALRILDAAAGGADDSQRPRWSTASLPTLLMDLGFHQNTVMACL
jgi:hypothetical protein